LFEAESRRDGAAIPASRPGHGQSRRPIRILSWLLFFAAIALGAWWFQRHRTSSLDRSPGGLIADFEIRDARTGQLHRLSQHRGRVVAIMILGTSCPVGDLYMPRLAQLARDFEMRDVDFLGINSNASDSIDDVAEHARRSQATFPVLKDPENRVADQLLAERTCEALVIDGQGRLRYRGAIDDQYGLGTRRDSPQHHYLIEAIESVLAGREVRPAMTPVVGCPIERTNPTKVRRLRTSRDPAVKAGSSKEENATPAEPALDPGPVTYARDVASILHRRCAACHRQGQVAPFPLLTYNHARRRAASIAEVIADGRMPPWHADPRFGRFSNDRSLSARERAILTAWIEQGTPPGDLSQAPSPPELPQDWSIGAPDVVFELPEPFMVPAEGTVPIKHFRMPTNLKEDLWIQAAEPRPGDRAVVHHILVYLENRPKPPAKQKTKSFLAVYLPGDVPTVFPPGIAKQIPAGSDLAFEVHYTPIGRPRFDRSAVGFILAKQPPVHQARTKGIPQHNLRIPPGARDHVERAAWSIPNDIQLLSLLPHMHLRGKSFSYTAQYPDGTSEILLYVPNYDFNSQNIYRLAEPKLMPKGTTIHCEAHYDNSAENPANPDPSRTVLWGEQTWDEMLWGLLDYIDVEPIQSGQTLHTPDSLDPEPSAVESVMVRR
jgi:hypothetical protein